MQAPLSTSTCSASATSRNQINAVIICAVEQPILIVVVIVIILFLNKNTSSRATIHVVYNTLILTTDLFYTLKRARLNEMRLNESALNLSAFENQLRAGFSLIHHVNKSSG